MLVIALQVTNAVQSGKSWDWHDVINIGGFALGILGVLLAIVSLSYAFLQTKLAREQKELAAEANYKVRTAEQAVSDLKDELRRRNAAQSYELLANKADALVTAIRSDLWEEAYDAAQKLGAGLHNSMGAYAILIDEDASIQVNECIAAITELLRVMPLSGETVPIESKRSMQQLATIVSFGNQKIAGKVRYIADLRNTDGQ